MFRVLKLLGQYPVTSVSHLKALAGEGREGEKTEQHLKTLVETGHAELVGYNVTPVDQFTIARRGWRGPRYALTHAGRSALWYAFGGKPEGWYTRSGLSAYHAGEWSARHQDGVYEILSQFREEGCAVGPGWRAHSTLATGGRIEPDGVVLVDTPWGRLWCNLELELSDIGVESFKERCEKYGSLHRRDANPLLMVCRNERAAENFQSAARRYSPDLRVATTTVHRIRDHGVLGEAVWRY